MPQERLAETNPVLAEVERNTKDAVEDKVKIQALLINPWIYDFSAYDLWSKPLGLLKIATALKKAGIRVSLIDCLDRESTYLKGLNYKKNSTCFGDGAYYREIVAKPSIFKNLPRYYKRYGLPPRVFREILKRLPYPDIILVSSGMSYWYKGVFEVISILKETFKDRAVLLGGIYASLCYEHAKNYSGADRVIRKGLRELFSQIKDLTGISYDFKEEPLFPDYTLYKSLSYISLRTSSGCPFRCSYCGWYILEDRFYQYPYLEVVSYLEYYYRKGIKNIAFYDDALLYQASSHIVKILEEILRRGIKLNFHTPNALHARFITLQLARLMRRAGFILPRLGFETKDASRQKLTGGKITTQQLISAIQALKKAGYKKGEFGVYLLMGLPGQSLKEVKDSIYFVHRLGARIWLEEYSPVPGTEEFKALPERIRKEPLYHNNSSFSLYGEKMYKDFQNLKDLVHSLNRKL